MILGQHQHSNASLRKLQGDENRDCSPLACHSLPANHEWNTTCVGSCEINIFELEISFLWQSVSWSQEATTASRTSKSAGRKGEHLWVQRHRRRRDGDHRGKQFEAVGRLGLAKKMIKPAAGGSAGNLCQRCASAVGGSSVHGVKVQHARSLDHWAPDRLGIGAGRQIRGKNQHAGGLKETAQDAALPPTKQIS